MSNDIINIKCSGNLILNGSETPLTSTPKHLQTETTVRVLLLEMIGDCEFKRGLDVSFNLHVFRDNKQTNKFIKQTIYLNITNKKLKNLTPCPRTSLMLSACVY